VYLSSMKLFLALSCLQGRPLRAAAEELLALAPDGLQLTPGNLPGDGDRAWLAAERVLVRTHHGFDWHALRRPVWSEDAQLLVSAHSVHPPKGTLDLSRLPRDGLYEVMYPGYALGCGDDVERAMALGLRLAVDVSHVLIQLHSGVMTAATWTRLQSYARVAELHVSDNDGRRDLHRPLTARSFGIGWARERAADGVPLVLECYMHKLSTDERAQQISQLRSH
jgi:hypothetical protein